MNVFPADSPMPIPAQKNREDCSGIVINHNSNTGLSTDTDNDDLLLIKQLIEFGTFVGL